MSLQIFLEGRFYGMERYLSEAPDSADSSLETRALWLSLASEILPRALLKELGLAPILLGFSSAGYFLLVLPEETRQAAEQFLTEASSAVLSASAGQLRLHWAATENLGEWANVRKRLEDELAKKANTPLATEGLAYFTPASTTTPESKAAEKQLIPNWLHTMRSSKTVGWSPEHPAAILPNGGKHEWPLADSPDTLPLARHAAPSDDQQSFASTRVFAKRAEGSRTWGVLRGNVDNFLARLESANSIEDYIRISVVFKQFFAGELEVACSLPEFWQKTTILFTGGDEFAVCGSWDALIGLAREIERLFERFTSETLADFPGPEAKSITMALALGRQGDSLGEVYREAGRKLDAAKTMGKGRFQLFGRSVEWKELTEASDLAGRMTKIVSDYRCSPAFLDELAGFYRESLLEEAGGGVVMRKKEKRFDKPWRFYRRLNSVLEPAALLNPQRMREFERRKTSLIEELISRSSAGRRLRPSGRVALEWARLTVGRTS